MGDLQAGTSELQESHTISTHAVRETISKVLERSSCIPLRATSGCCSRCRVGGERHEGRGTAMNPEQAGAATELPSLLKTLNVDCEQRSGVSYALISTSDEMESRPSEL